MKITFLVRFHKSPYDENWNTFYSGEFLGREGFEVVDDSGRNRKYISSPFRFFEFLNIGRSAEDQKISERQAFDIWDKIGRAEAKRAAVKKKTGAKMRLFTPDDTRNALCEVDVEFTLDTVKELAEIEAHYNRYSETIPFMAQVRIVGEGREKPIYQLFEAKSADELADQLRKSYDIDQYFIEQVGSLNYQFSHCSAQFEPVKDSNLLITAPPLLPAIVLDNIRDLGQDQDYAEKLKKIESGEAKRRVPEVSCTLS